MTRLITINILINQIDELAEGKLGIGNKILKSYITLIILK